MGHFMKNLCAFVTTQLIFAFVFASEKSWFSHGLLMSNLFYYRDSDSEGDLVLEGETESEKNKPAGKATKKDRRKKKKDDDW